MEHLIKNDALYEKVKHLLTLSDESDKITKQYEALSKEVKQAIVSEYVSLYKEKGEYFSEVQFDVLNDFDEQLSFIFQAKDQYIKIDANKADALAETYGENIISTEKTYTIPSEMVALYGKIISDLVYESDLIPFVDKGKIFVIDEKTAVRKGVIKELSTFSDDYEKICEDIKPIFSIKKKK